MRMEQDGLRIEDRGDFVLVEFSGKFSVETGKRCVDTMVEACATYQRSALLFDCRRMTGYLSIMDRFQVMAYGQITSGTISKLALLGLPEHTLPDNFSENVAVNRGVNLKIFTDFEEAVAWLGS
ncbi:MAG: hypothetical protein JXB45_04945 [Candidatus Krumholzibacteriota bacterium]|nr:hypothetical protein [Candidatus Krumholzibacteriota bacterium]